MRTMPRARSRLLRQPQLLVVSAVVAFNLWSFREALIQVAYLYDAPVHEQMVKFATATIEAGRLPYTTWFPYVGLGSAQFLHYQSLGAVLAGLAGVAIGAGNAFRWAIYLLVALWPIAIYSSARLFGFPRLASMVAAALSPFVVSYTGIAFERGAYSWIGGAEVWTQLFGMWALPFAWAFTWRALEDARFLWPAAALVGLTFAFHFLCGYLAFFGIIVLALLAGGAWARHLARAAVVFCGGLVSAAWVVVPLMLFSKWSAINEILAETPYVKGYGAGQELEWLFKGQIFDARRTLPVISVAVALGLAVTLVRWKSNSLNRGLLGLFVACLLLSFGATTWGPLIDLVPAHADLYFRRFNMGTQLAGIYLAGVGVAYMLEIWYRWAERFGTAERTRLAASLCFGAAAVAWFSPAGLEIYHYDQSDRTTIGTQSVSDVTEGRLIAPLINYVQEHGGGRVYAGQSNNWGQKFTVGYVPVYKYLVNQRVEETTYVVPTTSLMLGPEADFDPYNPADYELFGIRYLFLPTGLTAPVPARLVMARGNYSLWQYDDVGYFEPVEVTGTFSANRADIGSESQLLLESLGGGQDWAVRWPGMPEPPAPQGRVPVAATLSGTGVVKSAHTDLTSGYLSATVDMDRAGVLLAAVAFDPGWHAWVDGKAVKTEMMAPAVVGVPLARGQYHVVLRYEGFSWYPELWAASLLSLVALGVIGRRWHSSDLAVWSEPAGGPIWPGAGLAGRSASADEDAGRLEPGD